MRLIESFKKKKLILLNIFLTLYVGINFVGGDVVEVSPPFDTNNMTSYVAATIAFEILCTMTKTN